MTLANPKVFMEAMLSEMRHMMKLELEQVHERIDQIESARERQPQNVPNLRRRERVQPREVRVVDEEPYGAGFDEEDDRDSVVGSRRHGGFFLTLFVFLVRYALLASNLPLNANFLDCLPTNDDPHSLQAHVLLSKVHGEDGMVMEAQGAVESVFSPSILNANISNVHGHHDLSALLLESRLDDISEGVEGVAREDASVHDTYSAHSWADRAKEGEFIPQVALDLEAEFGGFLENPSFLMESFHGDSSSPSLRGRRNLNNGSHGGRGGGGNGARVAHGIQTNKHSFRQSFCGKEGLSLQDQNGEFPLRNRETHAGNGRPTLEKQKAENSGTIPLVRPAQCGKKGLTKKVTNDQYPLGTSGTLERAGGPSQDNQKADGTATSSSDLGGNRDVGTGDQLAGNVINQGTEAQAVQGCVTVQKGAFSDLICRNKELSYSDVRGGNTLWVQRVQPLGNPLTQRGKVRAVQGSFTTQKVALQDLMCGSKGLSHTVVRGSHSIGEGEYQLGNQGEALRAVLDMTATKSAFLKGLSIQAKNGEHPLVFTLEYVAPCMKEDKVVVKPPPKVLNEGNKMWATTLVGYFLDQKLNYHWVKN
ncbi:hypothetical protein F0562_010379 [Nyssa sinensis]|uniref:Uncharacterized protein n=1 Tax=Nyssa sinensis TaxID=561372 RepID=A0A5J5A141_9ASTE|nr:hypothetical protein F0562_010379 [Nyssa sinensis]